MRLSPALAVLPLLVACRVPVAAVVDRVQLSADSVHLQPADTAQLTAQVFGSDGSLLQDAAVRWQSTDSAVASVVRGGRVAAGRPGIAHVSATVAGRSATVPVIVRFPPLSGVRDIAHRAYATTFPENTVVAITGAFELGAEGVEVDVRLSYDGFPVVMHDPTVDRTTDGTGAVDQLTLERMRQLDACGWMGTQWGRCQVPTFEEAVIASKGRGMLMVDLKGPWPFNDIEKLIATLRAHGMRDSTVFISFSIDDLRQVRRADPRMKIGWLLPTPGDPAPVLELGGSAVLVEQAALRQGASGMPAYVERIRSAGGVLGAWTIRNASSAPPLRDLGVSWFITDVPLDAASINPSRR